jgi:DNA-binding NarL/FixJ family response regulator
MNERLSPAASIIGRALVIEDDRSWQQILSEMLTDAGLQVEIVDSLGAAVERLRAAPHRLAVVDLSLGGDDHHNEDGLRVLDAVRRQDPGCATIMLTGFATVELAVTVLTEHGAFTCLRKESFRRAEFREVIDQALASVPYAEATSPAAPDAAVAPEAGSAGREQVAPGLALIVEDDAGWRGILAELAADAGYQVRLCSSFGEALGRLRREQYALAVIDLSLEGEAIAPWEADASEPGQGSALCMDGYRLLASTRAGGVPTIVVSGVGRPEDIERAYAEQGIFAYLEKQTFSRRAFLQTVAEARAVRGSSDALRDLTERERETLALLAQGLTNKEIAERLVITTNTVKRHLKAIFGKLDVHTRSAAAAKAISAGVPAEFQEPGGQEA